MFASIDVFWTLHRLILVQAVRQWLKINEL